MRILALRLNDGSVQVMEAPAPMLEPGMVRVRTLHSAVSPGTEGNKIVTGKKSLIGKAKARPDQVKMVLDMARSVGVKGTIQKVRSKLEGAQPIGYSLAGEVLETGPGVEGLMPGDLVACGGGNYANHADEVVVPRNLCCRIPAGVSTEDACFATLAAIALQGLRLAEPTLGERAVVIGLGIVGQLAGQLLRANGCRVLGADIAPDAVALARRSCAADEAYVLGADPVEERILDFSEGRGADLVLICAATASNDPVTLAGRIARQRGRVVVVGAVGMDLPREDYYRKEIAFSVSCSYGPGRYDPSYEEGGLDYPYGFVRWTEGRNIQASLDLMASGALRPSDLVSHRYAFEDAPKAYALIAERSEPFAGILLTYPSERTAGPAVVQVPGSHGALEGRVGVGCIGAGSYAQAFLLPFFKGHDRAAPTSIFTRSGLSAVDAGKRYGFRRAVDSADAVLADPETAAVVVATRHDQHGPLALQALQAGKHVFVEKPLCLNEAELAGVMAFYAERGDGAPLLQTGFNRRFSPAAAALKKHFGDASGPYVMDYRVSAGRIPADHWIQDPAVGGGRIVGEVCHFIDLMQFLCGADPVEVRAVCVGGLEPAQLPQDDVQISLRFADGSIGTVSYLASGAKSLPKERLEVSANGRTGIIDNFTHVELHGRGGRTRKPCGGKGQQQEVDAFLASVGAGAPAIPLASQFATTLATFRALESLRSGAAEPVDLGRVGS
ncbi:MAG TPA: bi-domain-containing oxidoreductase [Candidatus Krumholzibacteria bacterium]|nr:bi-domain-containing oxidoreductase [Candidatus Krumholzibacteria bacterium]